MLLFKTKYGSSVYGTTNSLSDEDYIQVFDEEVSSTDDNIQNFTVEQFQQQLDNQEISVIESYFTNPLIGDNSIFHYEVNHSKLRVASSKKSSNSYVKAKKKITVEKDCRYIGLKSLFHSIRIIDFSIQLASTGRIFDFGRSNGILHELLTNHMESDWEAIEKTYKPLYNKLHSQFKVVCPK